MTKTRDYRYTSIWVWAMTSTRADERRWKARSELDPSASTLDFFTFHSNTINDMPAHITCPYTRTRLK